MSNHTRRACLDSFSVNSLIVNYDDKDLFKIKGDSSWNLIDTLSILRGSRNPLNQKENKIQIWQRNTFN